MGFFDKALDLAKNLTESFSAQVEKTANERREIIQELEPMGDTELITVLNDDSWGNSRKKRNIAYGILKKRGFKDEDLKYEQDD